MSIAPEDVREAPGAEEIGARISEVLEHAIGTGAAAGAVVGFRRDGQDTIIPAGERIAGAGRPLAADARFRLGCLIKPVLSLVCLELHARGEIDIDAPLHETVPELKGKGEPITAMHVLTHSTGYFEPAQAKARTAMTWDSFLDFFASRKQAFAPGTVWSYTQTAHPILARAIGNVTGRDPMDLIRETVFDPLGLTPGHPYGEGESPGKNALPHMPGRDGKGQVAYRPPAETGFFRLSVSDLPLSTADLLRLTEFIAAKAAPDFFSADAYRLFARPTFGLPPVMGGPMHEARPLAYGMGLAHYSSAIGHNGSYGGMCCGLRYDPGTGASVAIAINSWAPGLRDFLARGVLAQCRGQGFPEQSYRIQLKRPLASLAGTYRGLMLSAGDMVCTPDGDRLRCELTFGDSQPLAFTLSVDQDGFLSSHTDLPWLSLGLGEEPGTHEPYFMVGLYACRRISE